MPVFIRPSRVIVEESGGGLAALAITASALSAILDDLVAALAVVAAVAFIGSPGIRCWVLRRERGTVNITALQLPARPPAAITATARPAIEAPGVLLGVDRALGDMFDESRRWGANRIRECQQGPQLAKAQ